MNKFFNKIFVLPIIIIIKVYQNTLSPILKTNCRHMPTCSQYAILAFKEHGLFKGLYLSFIRILKCNPFGSSGYDPVPKKANRNTYHG